MLTRKKQFILAFLSILYLLNGKEIYAQEENSAKLIGNELIIKILRKDIIKNSDSIERKYELPKHALDTFIRFNNSSLLERNYWRITKNKPTYIILKRSIETYSYNLNWNEIPILEDQQFNGIGTEAAGTPKVVDYGFNKFKNKKTVHYVNDSTARFFYYPKSSETHVTISGNFNDWNPFGSPMIKKSNVWQLDVKLLPGQNLYKFIVDGEWKEDPLNKLKEDDGHSGFNSIYYHPNYKFNFSDKLDAKKVYLAGSFNDWNPNEIKFKKYGKNWERSIYLKPGLHTYKFIVDGLWILDPANSRTREDGEGNVNSLIGNGMPFLFTLANHKSAKNVILSGSFNKWRENELPMLKTENGWEINYELVAGNYEYKFVVDGTWMNDPKNNFTASSDFTNSFMCVGEPFVFELKGFENAKDVRLSGTFNDWQEPGYNMVRENNKWVFPIHLEKGKYLYKYIIDGNWIVDPSNSLWEENKERTGNSVLWIE